jgi:hypothetical protein
MFLYYENPPKNSKRYNGIKNLNKIFLACENISKRSKVGFKS